MLSQLRLAARAPRLQYSRVAPGQLEALRRA
jgi:hypothetical protein